MNEDNVAIRLKGFIDYLGISSSQFADQCGIPRPSLSQLLNGRNKKISDVLVGQIHAAYPELSVLWLMFGEGDMLVKAPQDDSNEEYSVAEGNYKESSVVDSEDLQRQETSNCVKGLSRDLSNSKLEDFIAEQEQTIKELKKEIELMKKSPRRVAQITVYYDDSTFETFFPGSSIGRMR